MDNNYKFTFVAGAPGSAWSMISFRMKITVPGYDKSDQTAERQYDLPEAHAKNNYDVKDRSTWKAKTHIGSYYGPYHGLGDQFDDLTYYNGNVEGFYDECLRPFNDPAKPRKLIKSHWFAYNLDWLWENCKGHDLMLVWRETDAADKWWHTMGGWDIKHPVYDWYVDDERMHKQIAIESDNIWEFGERKGVKWLDYDVHDSWIQKRFGVPFLKKVQATPKFEDTIKIGYITIT
jgi:hypothetical protein